MFSAGTYRISIYIRMYLTVALFKSTVHRCFYFSFVFQRYHDPNAIQHEHVFSHPQNIIHNVKKIRLSFDFGDNGQVAVSGFLINTCSGR